VAGFDKVVLLTGEDRGTYIRRRLSEGAEVSAVVKEINHPDFYSGSPGKKWAPAVVYAVRAKMTPKADPLKVAKKADVEEADEPIDTTGIVVPPEYEDILTAEDIADIRLEAAKNVRSAARKKARKEMLLRIEQELHREAAAAAQRGQARGDLVDVSIDLPEYAPGVTLDGVFYCHGTTPRVRRDVGAVLREQVSRAWYHQASISGQKSDFFNRSQYQNGGRVYQRGPDGGIRV
jgi:hypothetical protein